MARKGFMKWLLGSDTISQVTQIQPHPVKVGGVFVNTGALSPARAWGAMTSDILTTGVVGATVPDAWVSIYNNGIPPTLQVQAGGAPATSANNAPSGGSC